MVRHLLLLFGALMLSGCQIIQPKPVETPIPVTGLNGVGINSMALWSQVSQVLTAKQLVAHLAPLEDHGFSHVVLVTCADWIIGWNCVRATSPSRVVEYTKAVVANTKLHVVLSLKGYSQLKSNGKNTSELQKRLERDPETQQAFVDTWESLATDLRHIDRERLSFNLLNEPEFEQPQTSFGKRDQWLSIASRAIEAIRGVSPDRVIILEGIGKSLFANRRKDLSYKYASISELVEPLPFPDIIYGFHNYEPENFLQQAKYRSGTVGRPHTINVTNSVSADAARLSAWANSQKVPVILSETGCIGYIDGKTEGPKNPDDCGLFARDTYDSYVVNGIPVTWWALEKEKTIYKRQFRGDRAWMPDDRIPDPAIFSGFRLNY